MFSNCLGLITLCENIIFWACGPDFKGIFDLLYLCCPLTALFIRIGIYLFLILLSSVVRDKLLHMYRRFVNSGYRILFLKLFAFSYIRKQLLSHPVNYVYHKILLNENESYLVHVARQILLVTIKNV